MLDVYEQNNLLLNASNNNKEKESSSNGVTKQKGKADPVGLK